MSPEQAAAAAMVAEAKAQGWVLTGPDSLLTLFTKNLLDTHSAPTERLKERGDTPFPGSGVAQFVQQPEGCVHRAEIAECVCLGFVDVLHAIRRSGPSR